MWIPWNCQPISRWPSTTRDKRKKKFRHGNVYRERWSLFPGGAWVGCCKSAMRLLVPRSTSYSRDSLQQSCMNSLSLYIFSFLLDFSYQNIHRVSDSWKEPLDFLCHPVSSISLLHRKKTSNFQDSWFHVLSIQLFSWNVSQH